MFSGIHLLGTSHNYTHISVLCAGAQVMLMRRKRRKTTTTMMTMMMTTSESDCHACGVHKESLGHLERLPVAVADQRQHGLFVVRSPRPRRLALPCSMTGSLAHAHGSTHWLCSTTANTLQAVQVICLQKLVG